MIFSPVLAAKVMRGKKTVTRRVASDEPCRYVVGRTYAVQTGRGLPAIGRIRVLEVDRVKLGWIDEAEARLEGFSSISGFLGHWTLLHGAMAGEAWRIRFEVAETEEAAAA